jgi:hypothetical protein
MLSICFVCVICFSLFVSLFASFSNSQITPVTCLLAKNFPHFEVRGNMYPQTSEHENMPEIHRWPPFCLVCLWERQTDAQHMHMHMHNTFSAYQQETCGSMLKAALGYQYRNASNRHLSQCCIKQTFPCARGLRLFQTHQILSDLHDRQTPKSFMS